MNELRVAYTISLYTVEYVHMVGRFFFHSVEKQHSSLKALNSCEILPYVSVSILKL